MINSEVITVNPERAKLWLMHNTGNRKLSKDRINKYVRDINAGLWRLNGESIKISDRGIVLDGQHRLEAIVLSGKSIETVVIFGIPHERGVFETIDAGLPRSASDAMRVEGMKYATVIPSVVRAIANYDSGTTWDRSMSHVEVKSIIDGDYDNFERAAKAADAMKHIVVPSVWGAFYYMAARRWPESMANFHEQSSHMINISSGSPVIALNRSLSLMPKKSKADKNKIIERCIVAFNAHLQGRQLAKISLGPKRAQILK
jgi:hypothetical protein